MTAFLVIAIACDSKAPRANKPATRSTKTDRVYVEKFLRAWLLSDGTPPAEIFLSSGFRLENDSRSWPASLRNLPTRQRALKFARECSGAPSRCETIESCTRSTEHRGTNPPYDFAEVTVTDETIASNEYLRPFRGRQLVHVSFILRGCNIGVSILVESESVSNGRVLSIFYIAG